MSDIDVQGTSDRSGVERLKRIVFEEFLIEPGLYRQAGLEHLPEALAKEIGCSTDNAIERATVDHDSISLDRLSRHLRITDMNLISRTAAAVSAALKRDGVTYEQCCAHALIYAVAGLNAHVFSALRAAAAKNDEWARHHYLYGLLHGLEKNFGRSLWELGLALQREPYEEARVRVRRAMDVVESIRAAAKPSGA